MKDFSNIKNPAEGVATAFISSVQPAKEEQKKETPPVKEPKNKRASFRVKPSLWDSLTEWSNEHNYSVANALELAIMDLLAKYK